MEHPSQEWEGAPVDGSGFADDLFINGELPHHTAEAAKDIIPNNAVSLDSTLAKDRYTENFSKLEHVPSIRRYGEQRRLAALIPFGMILGRARHLGGRYAFNGSKKVEFECWLQSLAVEWAALGGLRFARAPWRQRRLIFLSRNVSASITGLASYAASPGELNRLDKKVSTCLRALCKGQAHDSSATERHGRSWTNAQLLHTWKCCQQERSSQFE